MNGVSRYSVILFADIAGSTRLYESLGNFRAREIVACVLSGMTRIVERYAGEIVKTIGDEIMCRFSSPDHAVAAAMDIQTTLQGGLFGADHPVQVRIGMHYGPVVHEDRDVYGDAVNVAARMSTIAKAGQILATQDTVRALSPPLRDKTRFFDAANVKGKEQTLVMCEVLWEVENFTPPTIINIAHYGRAEHPAHVLTLRYREQVKRLEAGSGTTLGRGENCDLVVLSPLASRLHARIEYRRGKFVLVDQSTNGTHVRTEEGKTFYLRREELPLLGHGVISLGEEIREGSPALIAFSV